MKEEKVEALTWFVDFANLDLQAVKPGDRAKLLVEAEEHLWPKEELKEYQSASQMRFLPAAINELLRWIADAPPRESPEYWTCILESQTAVRKMFVQHVLPTVHLSAEERRSKGKALCGFRDPRTR